MTIGSWLECWSVKYLGTMNGLEIKSKKVGYSIGIIASDSTMLRLHCHSWTNWLCKFCWMAPTKRRKHRRIRLWFFLSSLLNSVYASWLLLFLFQARCATFFFFSVMISAVENHTGYLGCLPRLGGTNWSIKWLSKITMAKGRGFFRK